MNRERIPGPRLFALLLAFVTVVVYLPVRQHGFTVYDDGDYIYENRIVQSGLTWAGVKWAFTTWHASNWHPLTWLSHMTDCELFGLDAGAHHLVNVLLHTLNAVLVFLLLRRIAGQVWPAAVVAALFAWHPLRVESVAWAAERKDVLCALFGLLALLAYMRYVELSVARSSKAKVYYGSAFLLFALGLLAKPMLVTWPFVLLLFDWFPLRRLDRKKVKRLVAEKVPFLALSAASCVVTFMAQRATAVLSIGQYPLPLRIGNALLSCVRYLLKTLWPVDLAVIYPLPSRISVGQVLAAAAVLGAISWFAWRMRRQRSYLLMGWLWYVSTLAPVIGLVQVGKQAMADRYTYLPHIGLCIAAVCAIRNRAERRANESAVWMAVGSGLVLVACIIGTERQLRFWRSDQALFSHAITVTGNNPAAHVNLGVAFEHQGRRDAAMAQYREALRIAPDSVEAHNNIANLLDQAGQTDEALEHFREALRLRPSAPLAHCNLGTLLAEQGRFDQALSEYAEAARLAPEDPRPHYLMGKAELRRDDSGAAISHFRQALRCDPDDLQSLIFLSRALSADPQTQFRDGPEALVLAERANALAGGEEPLVLDTLAMARAETGDFNAAQQVIQKAIDVATAAGKTNLISRLREHQLRFQSRLACRENAMHEPAKMPLP